MRLAEEHPEVQVAMVNVVDSAGLVYHEEETANAYAAAHALFIAERCYVDYLGQAQRAFGIRGVPLTLFIDGENNIRLRYPGTFSSYEELEEWLNYVHKDR